MAIGQQTFSDFGAAASDIFAGFGDDAKAQGDFAEAQEYTLAAKLATQNEAFTKESTAIKEVQQQRELTMNLGGQTANQASAGFTSSGSALDLMRDSAAQGALAHQVLGQQGLITEAGYQEQAQSYNMMATAATNAGDAEQDAATFSDIMGGVSLIAGLFTGMPVGLGGGSAPGGDSIGNPTVIGSLF